MGGAGRQAWGGKDRCACRFDLLGEVLGPQPGLGSTELGSSRARVWTCIRCVCVHVGGGGKVRGVESCCRTRQAKIQAVGWSSQPVNCALLGGSQYRLTRGPRGQPSPQGHSSLNLPTFPRSGNYHRMLAMISNPYKAPSGTQPLLFLAEFSGIFPHHYHSVP